MGHLRKIYVWILRIFVSIFAVRNLLYTLFSLKLQSNQNENSFGAPEEIGAILVTVGWIYRAFASIVLVLSAAFYLNGCWRGDTIALRFLIITDAFIATFELLLIYNMTKNFEFVGVLISIEVSIIFIMLLLLNEEVKNEESQYEDYDSVNQEL